MAPMAADTWRLLVTEPTDGATNMAIDEALWRGRHAGTSPATLRFFAWDPPTVSIGYGQPLDRHVDVDACRRFGVGLVRRPTGGSAIYHDGPERELTYCVTATADDLGVGAVVLSRGRVLLVRRGKPPAEGRWSLPGGLVDLGETSVAAARREVEEECGIKVRVAGLAGVLDRVTRDADGRVRYHWLLVDYLAFPESDGDAITAGDDAAEVRWGPIDEVERLLTTDGLMDMIRRAAALAGPGA